MVADKYQLRLRIAKPVKDKISTKLKKRKIYEQKRIELKDNDDMYAKFKEEDATKKRLYRKELSHGKRKRSTEMSKLRMREMRKRRKLSTVSTGSQIKTRNEREKLRTQWRNAKQKQRHNMTPQAKRRQLEGRREKYNLVKSGTTADSDSGTLLSADEIETAIQNATPRRKSVMKSNGIFNTPKTKKSNEVNRKIVRNLMVSLNKMKSDKTTKGRNKYRWVVRSITNKYRIDNNIRRALDVGFYFWRSASHGLMEKENLPDSSRGMSTEQQKSVQDFYLDEATTLPGKSTVNVRTLVQKVVLNQTTAQLHKKFLLHKSGKLSLSKFRMLRPKHCLTMSHHKFIGCLCEYCTNVELKLKVLEAAARRENMSLTIKDKFGLCNFSMCRKDGEYHDRKCVERKCSDCGLEKLQEMFACLPNEKQVNWKKWENGTITDTTGKSTKRKILIDKTSTIKDCIDELCQEAYTITKHLFVARWQHNAFKQLSTNVPPKWLVTVADFAENYRCVFQDEVQSAYYQYQQATVHPMIAYYSCPICNASQVREDAVFISADMKHDSFAVQQFTSRMHSHILIDRGVTFNHAVQFSDGCAAQFKSKRPFQHVSERSTEIVKFERAYFGSRHGKSPCDALGGVVKKAAEQFVKSRRGVIQNAEQLFNFCQNNMTIDSKENGKCEHTKRVFFYEKTINRPQSNSVLQTVKGTQQIHQVQGIKPGMVKSRNLACFCAVCADQECDQRPCYNKRYVDDWQEHVTMKLAINSKKKKIQNRGTSKSTQRKNDHRSVEVISDNKSDQNRKRPASSKVSPSISKHQKKRKILDKTKGCQQATILNDKEFSKSPLLTKDITSEDLNMELPFEDEMNLSHELDDSLIKIILSGLQDNIDGVSNAILSDVPEDFSLSAINEAHHQTSMMNGVVENLLEMGNDDTNDHAQPPPSSASPVNMDHHVPESDADQKCEKMPPPADNKIILSGLQDNIDGVSNSILSDVPEDFPLSAINEAHHQTSMMNGVVENLLETRNDDTNDHAQPPPSSASPVNMDHHVIVDTPSDMEALPEHGIWIQFFKENKNISGTWFQEEKPYFCNYGDVISSIPVPTISCFGSRILYTF